MASDIHSRKDHGVGAYPHVVLYSHLFSRDPLFVYSLVRIGEIMIESCHGDALGKVYMVAYRYRADNCAVEAYAAVVAYNHVAHSIVDATERLYDAAIAERETSVWRCVHTHAAVYYGVLASVLV